MSQPVIRVENLSKEYRLGTVSHGTLTHDLQSWWARLRGKEDPNSLLSHHPSTSPAHPSALNSHQDSNPHFLALNDVSFEVNQGDVLGIIGRNGAGKSTLLKILSQVTAPTKGEVKIKGRIASLLEVGTGFHPELTGRENVFLNGAILGMSKAEITGKFDEIVDFSGIEKFIDTPVKRYSSGMYVRLAFAVAAHLESEILIVDEVLAVGDAQFQKKCLGKMQEVGKQGRTVLFVSHNMAAVENLCQTGVILDKGHVDFNGGIADSVKYYLTSFTDNASRGDVSTRTDRAGEGNIRIKQISIKDQQGNPGTPFPIGSKLIFEIDYESKSEIKNPQVIIGIYDLMTVGVSRLDTEIAGDLPEILPATGRISCSTESMPLVPGRYILNIAFYANGMMQDYLAGAVTIDINASDYFKTGKIFNESDSKLTKILIKHKWKLL